MANDLTDILRDTLVRSLQDDDNQKKGGGIGKSVLAGAALAAAAPLLKRGVEAARSGELDDFVSKLGTGEALEQVRARFGDDDARDDEPEPDEQPEAEGGEDDGDEDEDREPSGGPPAHGKGRRLPVQQSVDVGVPLETAYNQFTQFEDWTEFMHRVTRVTQDDPCTVSFATKIWGKTKEFKAEILTQIPDERIKWRVSQGITHTGIVTFHELAPRLTRIELTMDVDPGSLLEKAARGMRFIKRAARADLHRFKAFIEMQEQETGAWRGVIIDGELVEDHDPGYDEEREYSDLEDAKAEGEDEHEDEDEPQAASDEDEGEDQEEDERPVRRRRRREREQQPAPA
jgi:cobalamin biosynthesis protein CobT